MAEKKKRGKYQKYRTLKRRVRRQEVGPGKYRSSFPVVERTQGAVRAQIGPSAPLI